MDGIVDELFARSFVDTGVIAPEEGRERVAAVKESALARTAQDAELGAVSGIGQAQVNSFVNARWAPALVIRVDVVVFAAAVADKKGRRWVVEELRGEVVHGDCEMTEGREKERKEEGKTGEKEGSAAGEREREGKREGEGLSQAHPSIHTDESALRARPTQQSTLPPSGSDAFGRT